jgi:small subunit ribosomal protein S6
MPLYQLVCIAKHYAEYRPLRTLLSEAASFVHGAGGNVRRLDSLGRRVLPKKMRKEGVLHAHGDYWTMDFDANPLTVRELEGKMKADPRVLRCALHASTGSKQS